MRNDRRRLVKFKFLMTAILATAFFGTPTWAAWHGSPSRQAAVADVTTKPPKTSNWNITLTIIESLNYTNAACTAGEGWADVCPSGDCQCYTYTGTASGTAGTGTVTFSETYDFGDAWVDVYEEGCAPAYGDIEIKGSKDTESIAFNGGDCGGDYGAPVLSGGCFLQDTDVYSTAGAYGQCSGSYDTAKKTKFTIKGVTLKTAK
jgi:hypothetical protein